MTCRWIFNIKHCRPIFTVYGRFSTVQIEYSRQKRKKERKKEKLFILSSLSVLLCMYGLSLCWSVFVRWIRFQRKIGAHWKRFVRFCVLVWLRLYYSAVCKQQQSAFVTLRWKDGRQWIGAKFDVPECSPQMFCSCLISQGQIQAKNTYPFSLLHSILSPELSPLHQIFWVLFQTTIFLKFSLNSIFKLKVPKFSSKHFNFQEKSC